MSRTTRQLLHRSGDPYPVVLANNQIDDVGRALERLWPGRRVAVVTQARVRRLHGARLEASLARAGTAHVTFSMREGEEHKSLATVERLYDGLLRHGFTRDDALLAFGGGTVGDTAGFVAATYMRGIPFAQLPTTLLAQIDSSIGGKVGVNHRLGKNLIGSIYRPSAVWIDPTLLATLPPRDLLSGFYELIKYGFIAAPKLLKRMETEALSIGSEALALSIGDGVRTKLDVVREDEHEHGLRRILNFGHTIGHGLEAASSYKGLRHGEAVGWGMLGAIAIAERRAAIPKALARRLSSAVRNVGPLPPLGKLKSSRVLAAVQKDKKRGKEGLRFILPVALGRVAVVENFPMSEIAWAVSSLGVKR